jgi:hypothetical protein
VESCAPQDKDRFLFADASSGGVGIEGNDIFPAVSIPVFLFLGSDFSGTRYELTH